MKKMRALKKTWDLQPQNKTKKLLQFGKFDLRSSKKKDKGPKGCTRTKCYAHHVANSVGKTKG